jgi:hypothetical protein
MIFICFGFFMAIQAIENIKISGTCMAFVAISPFAFMFSTVNREVLGVVVPSGW